VLKSTKEIREGNKNRYALSNSFLLDFFVTFCVKTKSKENKKMNNNLNVEVSDTTGDAINTIADKQIIKIINHTLCPGEIN